jgi:lipoprotein-anchoring transpeptidase ErfK/SrfK
MSSGASDLSPVGGEGMAMVRVAIAGLALASMSAATSETALAQWGRGWGAPGYDRSYSRYPYPYQPPGRGFFWGDDDFPRRRPWAPSSRSGGPRPEIAPAAPGRVAFPSSYPVGSIVIDHKGRQLFLIESPTSALHYPISVGREGFTWTGTERISKAVNWPDWRPPDDMRARDPRLPEHMSGGLRNPLGAKALYLGKTLYRIHGTNDPRSIGRAASSGCFRMLNGHVVDLASRVGIGTLVTVVNRLPPELERAVAQQVRGLGANAPAAPAARAPVVTEPVDTPAGEGAGGREGRRS